MIDGLIQRAENVEAENTELRKALRRIADGWENLPADRAYGYCQTIARTALDPGRPVPHHGSGPAVVNRS